MIQMEELKEMVLYGDPHVVSIYLTVNPASHENQAVQPGWRTWLKNALNRIEDEQIGSSKDAVWLGLRERVETFFEDYQPTSKSIALFLGREFQQVYELSIPVENEIHYGKPVVMPLLWVIDEYEPYLIILVDHEKARFFTASLGDVGFDESATLELDTSEWKEKTAMAPGRAVMPGMGRGSKQDEFEQRVAEHITRFYRETAGQIEQIVRDRGIKRIVLGGNEESTHAVRDMLHDTVAPMVVDIIPTAMYYTTKDILEKAQPGALAYERQHEMELVEAIINLAKSGGRGALGRADVMRALDMQQVEVLVLPFPVEDPELKASLPERVFACKGIIELVQGAAADRLRAEGGIGAKLHFAIGSKSPE